MDVWPPPFAGARMCLFIRNKLYYYIGIRQKVKSLHLKKRKKFFYFECNKNPLPFISKTEGPENTSTIINRKGVFTMKRGFGKGFFSGILVAALVAGLGVSAMAATRTITVDDNIRITLNGATFSPKDANGKDVPLFSYNGTTYAPVRAICEAAGLKVDFDSANYTAVLTTYDQYIASTPTASDYITVEKAKSIALEHAGVKADDAVFVKAGLDWDDGKVEYEVEFYAGNTEYDYDIDAATGTIRSFDKDWDDFSLSRPGNSGTSVSQDDLISEEKAKSIALAKAPSGATVVKCELDQDDGRYVYELELRSGRTEYDCEINAVTGVIVDWDVDYDD